MDTYKIQLDAGGYLSITQREDNGVALNSVNGTHLILSEKEKNKLNSLLSTSNRERELEKEVERLKGLIKKAWLGNGMDCECESCIENFNKFKTENNL